MKTYDAATYGIEVRRVEIEGEKLFEASVRELPDVREYADTVETAYQQAVDTIETTAEIFREKNRAMPAPAPSVREFSGRITLRVSGSIHAMLYDLAEVEGVSLNQHISEVLAHHCGSAGTFASIVQSTNVRAQPVAIHTDRKTSNVDQKVIQLRDYYPKPQDEQRRKSAV